MFFGIAAIKNTQTFVAAASRESEAAVHLFSLKKGLCCKQFGLQHNPFSFFEVSLSCLLLPDELQDKSTFKMLYYLYNGCFCVSSFTALFTSAKADSLS